MTGGPAAPRASQTPGRAAQVSMQAENPNTQEPGPEKPKPEETQPGTELCVTIAGEMRQEKFNRKGRLGPLWANVGAYHPNPWMHKLVELWAWNKSKAVLCDRRYSPWDDPQRRPSHADRRKALQRQIIQHELSTLATVRRLPRKILKLAHRLMDLAC